MVYKRRVTRESDHNPLVGKRFAHSTCRIYKVINLTFTSVKFDYVVVITRRILFLSRQHVILFRVQFEAPKMGVSTPPTPLHSEGNRQAVGASP